MKKILLICSLLLSIFLITGCELSSSEDLLLTDEQKIINEEHIEYLYANYNVKKVRLSRIENSESNCECKLFYGGFCQSKVCEVDEENYIWIYTICTQNNLTSCIKVKYDDKTKKWSAVKLDGGREFDNLEKKNEANESESV